MEKGVGEKVGKGGTRCGERDMKEARKRWIESAKDGRYAAQRVKDSKELWM